MKTAIIILLCCTLLTPVCALAESMQSNTDRPGADYYDFDMSKPDPKLCRDFCMIDMKCKAWTYARPNCPVNTGPNPHCWLKDDVPKGVPNNCCTSGTKTAADKPSGQHVRVRISPAQPVSHIGACPVTITFSGQIMASAPGEVQYVFVNSDGAESVVNQILNFTEAGSKEVSTTWTVPSDKSGWLKIIILSPQRVESPKAPFHVKCQSTGGPEDTKKIGE